MCVRRGEKYFRFLRGDRRTLLPWPNLGSVRARESQLKGDRRRPMLKIPRRRLLSTAMCFVLSLFASGHSFFFIPRPPLFLSSSIPSSLRCRNRRREDGGKRIILFLSFALSSPPAPPFTLIPIYVGANDPESGLSLVFSRDNGSSLLVVGSARRFVSQSGHQSLVKARLVVEIPMPEGGRSAQNASRL